MKSNNKKHWRNRWPKTEREEGQPPFKPLVTHPIPYYYVNGKRLVKCVLCKNFFKRSYTLSVGEKVTRHTILARACVWCIESKQKKILPSKRKQLPGKQKNLLKEKG